ncbi:MAG: ABC transporter substrate-binding protein [Anaerolineae bacterium]|nr:ABC transporter substrate-binding protein [Anaerolineae bacterium]
MKYRLALLLVLVAMIAMPVSSIMAQDGGGKYGEAPMLAAKVAAGELPPVEDRLPSNPRVIALPDSQIGEYGGQLRVPVAGGGEPFWSGQMVFWTAWHGLVNWNQTYADWEPNVAESVDVNEEATEYTFHLREGLKWSDGAPFTADDILFYMEDILANEEINGGNFPQGFWTPGGEPPVVEKLDDYTVKFTFNVPYGMFLLNMCGWDGWAIVASPKHYLSQFHIKYNPDGIDALIAESESATDWVSLFQSRTATGPGADQTVLMRDPNYPTMMPWTVKEPMGSGTQFTAERNPYYYWVDAEGNQLPYIDGFVGTLYQDDQTLLLDVLAGKFDTMANPANENRPLFFQNEATSGLKVYLLGREGGSTVTVMFNMTHADYGALFSEKDFRVGMSYAIDRQEIIDIVYFGEGTPRQISPTEDSPLYNEQLSSQYTEFDVDQANEYLDKVLPEKDSDGWRMYNGEKLSVVFTVQTGDYGLGFTDVAELLKGYYAEVGVDIILDVVANEVWTERRNDNSMEATVFTGEGGVGLTAIVDARYFVPTHGQSIWGNAWNIWYLEPDNPAGQEPPQLIKDQIALLEAVRQAPTSEMRVSLMQDLLQVCADNFWVLGISSSTTTYRPLNAKLANVPETWVDGWNPGGVAIAFPEQWYFTP